MMLPKSHQSIHRSSGIIAHKLETGIEINWRNRINSSSLDGNIVGCIHFDKVTFGNSPVSDIVNPVGSYLAQHTSCRIADKSEIVV